MAARLSAALVVAGAARSGVYDYKVLFLQRSSKTSAFASVHVFPGGVVDPEDSSPEWLPLLQGCSSEMTNDTSLRLTAMRECFEECGILVQKRPGIGRPGKEWQKKVSATPALFRDVMQQYSSAAECLASLRPVTRFITPSFETKRYDTIFYASETVSMTWLNPEEGTLRLMPPQWYMVRLMAPHRRWADVYAALPFVKGPMQPEMLVEDERAALLMPGDEMHSVAGAAGARHRLNLNGWTGSFMKPGVQIELEQRGAKASL